MVQKHNGDIFPSPHKVNNTNTHWAFFSHILSCSQQVAMCVNCCNIIKTYKFSFICILLTILSYKAWNFTLTLAEHKKINGENTLSVEKHNNILLRLALEPGSECKIESRHAIAEIRYLTSLCSCLHPIITILIHPLQMRLISGTHASPFFFFFLNKTQGHRLSLSSPLLPTPSSLVSQGQRVFFYYFFIFSHPITKQLVLPDIERHSERERSSLGPCGV